MVSLSNRQIRQMFRIHGKQEHQNRFLKKLCISKNIKVLSQDKVSTCETSLNLSYGCRFVVELRIS